MNTENKIKQEQEQQQSEEKEIYLIYDGDYLFDYDWNPPEQIEGVEIEKETLVCKVKGILKEYIDSLYGTEDYDLFITKEGYILATGDRSWDNCVYYLETNIFDLEKQVEELKREIEKIKKLIHK